MKHVTLIAAILMLVGGMLIPQRVMAESGYHPFVKNEYYLGAGNKPVPLKDITKEHFRSEAAYLKFKQGFEDALGRSLTDEGLRQILTSEGVRLVGCSGIIMTTGINDQGQTISFERPCYKGEQLIEVKVGEQWKLIASQGCLNLTFWQRKATPKPKPEPKGGLEVIQSGAVKGMTIIQKEVHVHTCDCGHWHCDGDSYTAGHVILNFNPGRGTAFSLGE